MSKDYSCPHCQLPLSIPENLESGIYTCPYQACSKDFYFDAASKTILQNSATPPEERETLKLSSLLDEFSKAIDIEIKEVKKRGGDRAIYLKNGECIYERPDSRDFIFDTDIKVPIIDGNPATIEIFGRDYKAVVIRFGNYKLEIKIIGYTENAVPSGLLKIDATVVLRNLKEAIASLHNNDFNTDLALKVFNKLTPVIKCGSPKSWPKDNNGVEFNEAQSEAIKKALGSEVFFIQGPPGTGKTKTIVGILYEMLLDDKRTLIVTHTNIAADNVIKAIFDYDQEPLMRELIEEGKIIRIGEPRLKDSRLKELTIDEILTTKKAKMLYDREQLMGKVTALEEEKSSYYSDVESIKKYFSLLERMKNAETVLADMRKEIMKGSLALRVCMSEQKDEAEILRLVESRNWLLNFLKRTSPKRTREKIRDIEIKGNHLKEKLSVFENRADRLQTELEKLESEVSVQGAKVPEDLDIDALESKISELSKEIGYSRRIIQYIDDELAQLERTIVDNAAVIVTTLSKAFMDPLLSHRRYHAVIIDEASIAPLPMVFYASCLGKGKVILLGDFRQLAPIALANNPLVDKWLKRDIYDKAGVINCKNESRICGLQHQYRMDEEIFHIVNHYFYDDELINSRDRGDFKIFPVPDHSVVMVDSADAYPFMGREKTGPKSYSRFNLYHVEVISKIVHDLLQTGNLERNQIGVITPYKSQADFIRESLKEYMLAEKDIEVGTVHGFQGLEKQCIIFDIVDSRGGKKPSPLINENHIKYLGKKPLENDAVRLLTVAFSRAKEKLIILADRDYLLKELSESSKLMNALRSISRNQTYKAINLVPFYVQSEKASSALLIESTGEGREYHSQRDFYRFFLEDLKNATNEVLICSPFISADRLSKVWPYLVDLIKRQVKIKIFTKPPRETMTSQTDKALLHSHLNGLGAEVFEYYGLHEKFAVIDKRVLYEGSLNILSWRGTTEMMTRIERKGEVKRYLLALSRNYPRIEDCLAKDGYVSIENVVDLTPEKYKHVIEGIRPKRLKVADDCKGYYRSMLKKLRWVIADDKGRPFFAVLFNDTIELILNKYPSSMEELLNFPEFQRNKSNIRGYENIIFAIVKEYAATCS